MCNSVCCAAVLVHWISSSPSVRPSVHQFISVRILSSPLPLPSSCPDQRLIGHLLLSLYHSSLVRASSVGSSVRSQANARSHRQPCSVFDRRVIASLVFICLRHLFSPLPVFDTRLVSLASSLPRRYSCCVVSIVIVQQVFTSCACCRSPSVSSLSPPIVGCCSSRRCLQSARVVRFQLIAQFLS